MEGFADIDGPVQSGWLARLGIIALVALAIALLGLAGRWLWKRKNSPPERILEAQRSPLEIAMERLDKLQSQADQMEADPFIVEVSDIARDYLETALRIPAREQTSEEFLHELQARAGLPDVLQARMPQFLDQCDLVKFARQVLAETQRDLLLETAGIVVRETDNAVSQLPADREVASA